MIVRDGAHLLISVDVGSGSALAVPFKLAELGGTDATLVVRLVSAETPCAACVDERLARAAEELGGLGAEGVFRAVRAAIAGCAARVHGDPPPGAADAGGPAPESARVRSSGSLRLAPANAPCVPAGGVVPAESDIDVILII
ncbi:hypothetical protein [Sorangium cellulosum]|uniref:hypothetical protein n=1 Tax=Sorangium cellulosum TaxID=56 RepID=UPI000CF3DE7B|nr:hypothetical protein [Sorangium cellulosum]